MDSQEAQARPIFILVMGVSGSGKTTLGKALAQKLELPFFDADDLHPQCNIDKMSNGNPLTDADREPWLELVRTTAEHACVEQQIGKSLDKMPGVVIACSALKRYYRGILRGTHKPKSVPSHFDPPHPHKLPTYTVFLSVPRGVLEERMSARKGHFMSPKLLDSQLETLESPEGEEGTIKVLLEDDTDTQVRFVIEKLHELTGDERIRDQ
ncbi:carbohydrate kinase [Hysterangium stoloniferum]|nr:carbohydrate kinase [Hysterangium stoloniferum]